MASFMKAINRIQRDLTAFYREPPPGIYVMANNENLLEMDALIVGPDGTPYEKGFFYFTLKFPDNYPSKPPNVKLMTTANGTVGFNPNLYDTGYVCLSILGTWSGPGWSAQQSLSSVLVSIQSIMNEEPFFNEPGYETSKGSAQFRRQSEAYNEDVIFHTLQVAVADMLENRNGDSKAMPQVLRDIMESLYVRNKEYYTKLIESKAKTNTKYRPLIDRFKALEGKFQDKCGENGVPDNYASEQYAYLIGGVSLDDDGPVIPQD